ncbi:MAG: hypothetical protein KUG80_03295 [Gammaproteobacteria bacterium]|nr:hypothetical protein [Gammaproteobacteria bacterium]
MGFRETGGLDLLEVLAVNSEGSPNFATISDIVEWREDLGLTMTCRATLRCGEKLAARFDKVINEVWEADTENLALLQELSLSCWDEIANASNNLAYRLALNSFKAVYEPFRSLMKATLQNTQKCQNLADVIRCGGGDKAALSARSLVSIGGEKVLSSMNKKEEV